MNTAELIEYFRCPKSLIGVEQVSDVPQQPGFCAIYSLQVPKQVDLSNCIKWNSHYLLYIGSSNNLRNRTKNHIRSDASHSTFRKSVGCLLQKELGIHLQLIDKRCHFGSEEHILSEWISKYVKFAWICCEPSEIDTPELIQELSPPLNLDHNPHNPLKYELKRLRGECKKI